jgi:hypothetical protein
MVKHELYTILKTVAQYRKRWWCLQTVQRAAEDGSDTGQCKRSIITLNIDQHPFVLSSEPVLLVHNALT